jgi:hypothetical protein
MSLRIENANRNSHLFVYDPHRFGQIGVIGDDHELIAVFPEGIDQHICGDIYVRTLFFHLEYFRKPWAGRSRVRERHRYRALQIMTIVHGEIR